MAITQVANNAVIKHVNAVITQHANTVITRQHATIAVVTLQHVYNAVIPVITQDANNVEKNKMLIMQ